MLVGRSVSRQAGGWVYRWVRMYVDWFNHHQHHSPPHIQCLTIRLSPIIFHGGCAGGGDEGQLVHWVRFDGVYRPLVRRESRR